MFCTNLLLVSLEGAVLIGLMLLISRVCRFRYLPELQYWFWLLLALRLLVPITVDVSLSTHFGNLPEQMIYCQQAQSYVAQAELPTIGMKVPDTITIAADNPFVATANMLHWYEGFLIVWLTGIVFVIVYQSWQYNRQRKNLLRWSELVTEESILQFYRQISILHNKIRPPKLYWCSLIVSPMVLGWFRPVLLLPVDTYHEEDLRLLLSHELQHYYHGDIPYKFVLTAVCALHWFNPLVYAMARQANRNLEFCCDYAVLKNQPDKVRARYSYLLLEVAAGSGKQNLLFTTGFSMAGKQLQQRIQGLFAYPNGKRGVVVFAILVALLLTTGFALVPREETANAYNGLWAQVDVDGDGVNENIYRAFSDYENWVVFDICWADGRKLSRPQTDFWGQYHVEPADLDGDGQLEIITWFDHSMSTGGDAVGADLVIFDLQPDGSYQQLALPRFDCSYAAGMPGLDFQLVYQPDEDTFLLMEDKIGLRQKLKLQRGYLTPEEWETHYALSEYTVDNELCNPINAEIKLVPEDGRPVLQVHQLVGVYHMEFLDITYQLSWNNAGQYQVQNLVLNSGGCHDEDKLILLN